MAGARAEQLDRLSRNWRGTVRRRKVRNAAVIAATIIPIAALAWSLGSWSHREAPAGPQLIAIEKPGTLTPALSQGEREKNESLQVVREPTAYEQTLAVLYRHQAGLDRRGTSTEISATASTGPVMSTIDGFIAQMQLCVGDITKELAAAAPKFEIPLRDWYQRSMAAANDDLIAQAAISSNWPFGAGGILSAAAAIVDRRDFASRHQRRGKYFFGSGRRSVDRNGCVRSGPRCGRTHDRQIVRSARKQPRPDPADGGAVLGSLNNPNVSQRLAQMALEIPGRREALIGLLSSSDPVARKFLAGARHDAQLAPSIRRIVRF